MPVRTLVVWCPHWPVAAAGVAPDVPGAVFSANRVVAATPAARDAGVVRHQRRREAQARCPDLVVVEHDPARDARAFEPVVVALDALTPRVELTVPGQAAFATRGPSRWAGGDLALARRTRTLVAQAVDGTLGRRTTARVGVADGVFAATLAARSAAPEVPTVVAPGATPAFLAPVPLAALDRPDLVDVLGRLGLRTLGDLAALRLRDVAGRFGAEGVTAWQLASGRDERPPATEPPPPDLTVAAELDPPATQVAPAAFVARGLADELHRRLGERGSACTRVLIGAETEHGERYERVWRHGDGTWARGTGLAAGAIADRVRWQLEGWLAGPVRHRPTSGLVRLWLAPDEVVPATGRQLGFWGTDVAGADRATRAVARVEGVLGTGSVTVPEWHGGRDPASQVVLVDAAGVDLGDERPAARSGWVRAPWPGRLPAPSPATVHAVAPAAELVDEHGAAVAVSGRGELSAPPHRLRVAGGPWAAVTGWAGPWPLDERWWDHARRRRRARLQLTVAGGEAHLVVCEGGAWHIEATYD